MSDDKQNKEGDKQDNDEQSGDKFDVQMFARISGIKPDQLYAFTKHGDHAQSEEQTLDQWKKLLQDFVDRPI